MTPQEFSTGETASYFTSDAENAKPVNGWQGMPADHGRGTEERSKVDRAQTGRIVCRKLSNRHDATITVKTLERVSAHNWRLADRNRCDGVDAVSWQPSSVASAARPVVCLDVAQGSRHSHPPGTAAIRG